MRIGFFTDGYLPQTNGVATSVEECAQELRRRGHKVYIIAPKHPEYRDKHANVIRLTSFYPWGAWKESNTRLALHLPERSLLKVLRTDFDIIHGHAGGPVTTLGWEMARLKNVPYVLTYHTLWKRYSHYFLKGRFNSPKILEIISRVSANRSDTIIAPTERVKKELVSYGVDKPIAVIPTGVDLSAFSNTKEGYLRKRLKLNKTDKVLLTVGRLGKEKSFDFLLQTLPHIIKFEPNARLVIVGEGSEHQKLVKLSAKLKISDYVYFAGKFEQRYMPFVYKDADMFVFASKTETQGMVVLEAMASGLPVVAVDDKVYDGIVENGENALLTRKDKKEFAKKVVFVLQDSELRKRLSRASRQTAKLYSITATVDKLEKLYEQVIANNRVTPISARVLLRNIYKFVEVK